MKKPIPARLPRTVALAALALALGCDREPRTVVAAPASPPPPRSAPAPAPAPGAPVAQGQRATAGKTSEGPGPPSTAALVAQVDAMRAELDRREKPLEILLALGNLYYENARYPDAVEWYRQAIEVAEPGWKRYLALPADVRATPRRGCPAVAIRSGGARPGYAELSAAADARARQRDLAGAAGCWREALAPAVTARIQRGNAYLLAGDAQRAVTDQETVLARLPDEPEALWYLGLAIAESAGGDPAKLARAGALWDRLERVQPKGPHTEELRTARAELARRMSAAGR